MAEKSTPRSNLQAPSIIPTAMASWYVTLSDGNNASTILYNEGYNQPNPNTGSDIAFLDFGGVCSTTSIYVFNSSCPNASGGVPDITVAWWAEQWLYGYASNANHHNRGGIHLALGTNNSLDWGTNTGSIYNSQGQDFYEAIAVNALAYANQLNQWAASNNYGYSFYVDGANDTETNWEPPAKTQPWYDGWNTKYFAFGQTAFLHTDNFGAEYSTCSRSSCWNTVTDHGWTPHQLYAVNNGLAPEYSAPEMYNNSWGAYYKDLNLAAVASGYAANPVHKRSVGMWHRRKRAKCPASIHGLFDSDRPESLVSNLVSLVE
jgi:hypothetical protein